MKSITTILFQITSWQINKIEFKKIAYLVIGTYILKVNILFFYLNIKGKRLLFIRK